MRICIATPAPRGSTKGNRITAIRWARLLRDLGHRVVVSETFESQRCDLLVALHALRSYVSVARYRKCRPHDPLVVALTGTDLYRDLARSARARRALEFANRLVVLQPEALAAVPVEYAEKTRVIFQSAQSAARPVQPLSRCFEVCVVGHLRGVKDPFRTALASRQLPDTSRIQVTHIGAALSPGMGRRALQETALNPRYRWWGERSRAEARRLISRCRLLVVSSKMEGGPNVATEAIAAGTSILATAIPGMIGLLGRHYPGYFPVGDTCRLATLLDRCECDRKFQGRLRREIRRLRPLVSPSRERRCWQQLVSEVSSVQRSKT